MFYSFPGVSRLALAAVGLGLFLTARGMALDVAPGVAPPAPVPAAAGVVLEPAGPVDLHDMLSGEVRDLKFKVVNKTDKPIRIARLRVSCSCTIAEEPSKDPIAPGASSEVKVRLLGAKLKNGPFERSVMVEFADAPVPMLQWSFKGVLLKGITVLPTRDLRLKYTESTEDKWERVLQIVGSLPDGQRLRLGTPVEHPRYALDLKELEPSKYQLTVRPRLPQSKGRILDEIRLPVLEPAKHEPIVIRVYGQIGPLLRANPKVVVLHKSDATATINRDVVFYKAPPVDGNLVAAMSSREGIPATSMKVVTPPGITYSLREATKSTVLTLGFTPAVFHATGKGRIEVQTDCCGGVVLQYVVTDPTAVDAPPALDPTADGDAMATTPAPPAGDTPKAAPAKTP